MIHHLAASVSGQWRADEQGDDMPDRAETIPSIFQWHCNLIGSCVLSSNGLIGLFHCAPITPCIIIVVEN